RLPVFSRQLTRYIRIQKRCFGPKRCASRSISLMKEAGCFLIRAYGYGLQEPEGTRPLFSMSDKLAGTTKPSTNFWTHGSPPCLAAMAAMRRLRYRLTKAVLVLRRHRSESALEQRTRAGSLHDRPRQRASRFYIRIPEPDLMFAAGGLDKHPLRGLIDHGPYGLRYGTPATLRFAL